MNAKVQREMSTCTEIYMMQQINVCDILLRESEMEREREDGQTRCIFFLLHDESLLEIIIIILSIIVITIHAFIIQSRP